MAEKKEKTKQESPPVAREVIFGLSFVFNFGFVILVPALLGLWLGLTLDNRFDTKPWYTLILLGIGIGLGFYSGILQVKKFIERSKKL